MYICSSLVHFLYTKALPCALTDIIMSQRHFNLIVFAFLTPLGSRLETWNRGSISQGLVRDSLSRPVIGKSLSPGHGRFNVAPALLMPLVRLPS